MQDEAQDVRDGIFREPPLAIHLLTPVFGAEITGATQIQGTPLWLARVLNQLWSQYGILLFRDVDLDEAGEVLFSRMFGELEIHWKLFENGDSSPL